MGGRGEWRLGRKVWNQTRASSVSLIGNLLPICLKLANLEQAEGLRQVFSILWPKGIAEVSCLVCDARFLKGLQSQLYAFSSTLSTGTH